jgi:phytoene dehydrogenase-like protein
MKIAIIGAGVAGLSAGCYGRMNGFDTEIFEMHSVPGGVCTGWKRKGYTFDGCLHWLTGSAPASPLYRMWQELGILKGKKVIDHEEFMHVVTAGGRRVVQYASADRFIDELIRLYPEDREALETLRADIKTFGGLRQPLDPPAKKSVFGKLAMLKKIRPYLPLFKRYGKNMNEFLTFFKNPELRRVFALITMLPDIPATSIVSLLSMFDRREAGWPEGGSLALARSLEARYRELGGVIRYNARVEEILVERGRACGVRLADGSAHRANEVIGAADGRSTIFGMLKGRYLSANLRKVYDTFPLYTPFVQVSFGVNRKFKDEPRLTTYGFEPGIHMGSTFAPWLMLNNYGFDPSMAPPGKTALSILFWSAFDNWEKLANDRSRYLAEKRRIEEDATAWLESVYPGIRENIEVIDVATPLTTVRYTGNYRASYEGWRPCTATMRAKVDKTLPGLKHFSMIGQWSAPFSGLPTVAKDGREVIKGLCRAEGVEFTTSVA